MTTSLHSRLPRGVRPRLEGKPRTPLSSRVVTRKILQTRTLAWVAMSSSRGSFRPRDQTCVFCIPCIGRWILYHYVTWEAPQINSTSTKKKKKGYKSQAFTSGMGGRRACRSQSLHPKGPCSCGLCASGALPWGHYVPGEPR